MRRPAAAFLLAFAVAAAAGADVSPPSEAAVPVRLSVSVLDVDDIDPAAQSFVANVYLEARWMDARLAHPGPGERAVALAEIWHPRIQFLNQQRVVTTLPAIAEVAPGGEVVYRQRVWGPFSQPLDVADFPFDEQDFDLLLIAAGFDLDEVVLQDDPERPSAMAPDFSVADWSVETFEVAAEGHRVAPQQPELSLFRVTLRAERHSTYFLVKVIVPLLMIVGMACVVFWLDPSNASTQIGVATTSMLTLIAYRFTLAGYVPRVSYLTRMDTFLLGASAIVFLILVVAVATAFLAARGRLETALRLERHCRWAFPLAVVALGVFALLR